MRLKERTAIITGASRGIGKAIALKFAQEGADLALIYASNDEAMRNVCDEVSQYGVKVKSYKCDVSDYSSVSQTIKRINETFGEVDILVNNAGVVRDGVAFSIKEEDFDLVVDTSLKGAFNMIKACYYGFIRRRYGKIINISSVSGIYGNAGQANYSSAKAGLIGLTKSIAKELGVRNICCNAVAPGIIDTDMTNNVKYDEKRLEAISLRRIGTPEDVANAVLFLASSESDYITGEVIKVDGNLAM
jgi:3-oxoacyl-[acyl-carrier protein] reductase